VLSIFENVLQHYPLSVQTDFFEAGGSSIGVLGVISAIETKHGIRVPAARFIESRTPRALAAIVESTVNPPTLCFVYMPGEGMRCFTVISPIG